MKQKTILAVAVMILTAMVLVPVAEAASLGSRPLSFTSDGEDVKELQARLAGFGYYSGPISGQYGQQTERAVIRYQQDNNLAINGISDWRTINSLTSKQYQVRAGDTLSRIARSFDTTVRELRAWNNLSSDSIRTGRMLTIPHSNSSVEASVQTREDTQAVQAAETEQAVQATETSQDSSNYEVDITDEEFELLARAVYSEARGEPYKGQVAIAAVVLNRVEDQEFPNSIKDVIFEPWAFTAVHDGQFWLEPDQESRDAVEEALKGWDPSRGAVFYYNPVTATSQWMFDNMRSETIIGKHHFST
ncbi:cell wall hydrolase [Natroniella sulfidigena]|uniref:cell wall hydrolase n=1 Tax=Natroniella sulfidigena TaxID=723921 RepID=UPI00200A2D25|nr:cell wall hydrolase [Natroniella sulfidigena]MCK8816473.1 cell wall hydrolase [Natroniella sulfidigena]